MGVTVGITESTAVQRPSPAWSWQVPELLESLNVRRHELAGAGPVLRDLRLELAARLRALEMERMGYFGHVSPRGRTPHAVLASLGLYPRGVGEVLARGPGSAVLALALWLESPRHRACCLNPRYQIGGAARALLDGRPIWVMLLAAGGPGDRPLTPDVLAAPDGTAGEHTPAARQALRWFVRVAWGAIEALERP